MEDTPPVSNNTKLKNRTLWFDGDSSYPANKLHTAVVGDDRQLFVDQLTADVVQYNQLVSYDQRVQVKQGIRPLSFDWTIPDEYRSIDIREYVIDQLDKEIEANKFTDEEIDARAVRVAKELKLYKQHDLHGVLRVLIYVINTLNTNSVVWGVGRGSSVSSYILYLLRVHDVDSVKYDLDIEDFLH